jgi:hypothetical protein
MVGSGGCWTHQVEYKVLTNYGIRSGLVEDHHRGAKRYLYRLRDLQQAGDISSRKGCGGGNVGKGDSIPCSC